jgi:hypothetical protein
MQASRRRNPRTLAALLLASAVFGCHGDRATGPTSGSLALTIQGLPAGLAASITVAGGAGANHTITGTDTISGLAPGTYSVVAQDVTTPVATYRPQMATQTVQVAASAVPSNAVVTYALATGGLTIVLSGLPSGLDAALNVDGPDGFHTTVIGSQTVSRLAPGAYHVTGANATSAGAIYSPVQAEWLVTVGVSLTPALIDVSYSVVPGALDVTVTGLPAGADAHVTIVGPSGPFQNVLTSSQLFSALAPGTYVLTAASVTVMSQLYGAIPSTISVQVVSGATAPVTVAYGEAQSGLNLTIDHMYLVQSVQRPDGSIPLVKDKDAVLRVFVRANEQNSARPVVRVELRQGGQVVLTRTITSPTFSVPTIIDDNTTAAWTTTVAGSLIQPGLSMDAELDPTGEIPELDENDNLFPLSGQPLALDVRATPAFNVRFVPVMQSVNGLTGNISEANKQSFLDVTRRMHPFVDIVADVHATYTTSAPALQSSNGNNAWSTILNELSALRVAEGSPLHYFGIVHTSYTSGVAGLAFRPGRTGMGWDFLPSASEVAAHEWGHNWGRAHAPTQALSGCAGVPTDADPLYPYAQGRTGVAGYDVTTSTVKPSTQFDIMGYCSPKWISDYTYTGIMSYRATNGDGSAASADAAPSAAVPSLLVWGRITAQGIVLEPAFEVTTRPQLPSGSGAYTLEGLDVGGRRVFAYDFDGDEVADADGVERDFAFAIPEGGVDMASVASLRVSGLARQASLTSATMTAHPELRSFTAASVADAHLFAGRTTTGAPIVTWDAQSYPMALVRDAATGAVLSFARGGQVAVSSAAGAMDVVLSDRVHSVERRVAIPPR